MSLNKTKTMTKMKNIILNDLVINHLLQKSGEKNMFLNRLEVK